ncbi:hypothetical protein LELG_00794 [Lodderomyces elongisporus NRRL YB-4239]|uniref:Uncharacterized protein n=1 Tax=Lodderomyces elongisporus (strain ATCC 11503 / CBS 2605 / JCM 1781 / NBRC 1676 / NRRL YB-4239) TaxID=379508 RepID=A5DTV8_LODEL|nr:hypothetical protein LELG_00794 [Lodderomyces elongisporus NRRL YB-4239]
MRWKALLQLLLDIWVTLLTPTVVILLHQGPLVLNMKVFLMMLTRLVKRNIIMTENLVPPVLLVLLAQQTKKVSLVKLSMLLKEQLQLQLATWAMQLTQVTTQTSQPTQLAQLTQLILQAQLLLVLQGMAQTKALIVQFLEKTRPPANTQRMLALRAHQPQQALKSNVMLVTDTRNTDQMIITILHLTNLVVF